MIARNFLDQYSSTGVPLRLNEESEQLYWTSVLTLVTQARRLESSALLKSHPKANTSLFRDVVQLLAAMPTDEKEAIDRKSK